jgi:hypothetical protein
LKHCAVLIEFIVKMAICLGWNSVRRDDLQKWKCAKDKRCPYREDPSFVELVQLSDELKTRTPNCDRDCNSPSTRDPKAK